MLYHLYELQPNSFKSNIDIKMEWDSMWRPMLAGFSNNNRWDA
jgi:hypothetical protein